MNHGTVMPQINRPLSGVPLHFCLNDTERSGYIDESLLMRSGRSARTLLKEGALRVTLIALAPGGELAQHQADGPITVQLLRGEMCFRVGEEEWALQPGDLLSLSAHVPHAVKSERGAEFLLTVASAK